MKIIQSLWTKPVINNFKSNSTESTGGWPSQKHFLMSWSLSCNTIAALYDEVHLYTDEFGKYLLKDILKLPYVSVHNCLGGLENTDLGLWAMAKIETYKLQNKPFIHIDGDIYLFNKMQFDSKMIIVQNEENNFKDYDKIWQNIQGCYNVPKFLSDDFIQFKEVRSCNTGFFGGSDIEFIKIYVSEVERFLEDNAENFTKTNLSYSVLIYEQYLLSALARRYSIEFYYLVQKMSQDYREILNYTETSTIEFVHVLGDNKKKMEYASWVENQLLLRFPDSYYRIVEFIKYSLG